MNTEFFKAAAIRAFRTFCQVFLGYISVGMTIKEINWENALSVSIVAMLYSLLTSCVTKLPEVK